MYRTLQLLFITIITSLLAATNARAQQEQQLEGWPEWVQEGMQVESRRMKFRKVTTPDESVRSKLPGKPEKPQAIEDGWYFVSDIKAKSPLECYVFTSSRDLATLTDVITEANIEAIATDSGTVTNRKVFHTSSGVVNGLPYLALEWLYTIEGDTQALIGFTKVRAATKGNTAFLCVHNYLGYRETFAKAFAEFVTSAEYEDATETPYYEEIAQIDMNGVGTGIAYVSYTVDEEGDIKMYSAEASITAVDPSTIITSDSYTISYSLPDGEFINAYNITVENGEISNNLSLQRNDEGTWISGGTLQGKTTEVEIDGSLTPSSELQQMEQTKNLFAGNETTTSSLVWVPGIDPTRLLESTMTRDDAEIERQATLTLGPLSYSGRFDTDGNMSSANMNIGPVVFDIHRIWSDGSLRR